MIQYKSMVGEMSLNYKTKDKPKIKILRSADAYEYCKMFWPDDIEYRESFYVLALNRASNIIAWIEISKGGTTGTVADKKMIFQSLLMSNADRFIIMHNHPSGQLKPSEQDIKLSKDINMGSKYLELTMLDSIIITTESFYSMADNGIL